MKEIFSFSSSEFTKDEKLIQYFGMRGRNLMDLAALGIPILPGFILTEQYLVEEEESPESFKPFLVDALGKMGTMLGKNWSADNPLLIKLVISPMLNMVHSFSSIHNIGLCDATIDSFASYVGDDFAYHEYRGVIRRLITLELVTAEDKSRRNSLEKLETNLKKAQTPSEVKSSIVKAKALYPEEIFLDPMEQFQYVKSLLRRYFASLETLGDSAILVQAMTFGNYTDDSYFGSCTTRNAITGDAQLSGYFISNAFDATEAEGQPIEKLKKTYLEQLKVIAKQLEASYKEIRTIKFNIERGQLWIIDQSSTLGKTTQAEIRTILNLLAENVIDDIFAIKAIQPSRLLTLLHPVLDQRSASKVESISGGISGAIGAATGRVYFSTPALIDAWNIAQRHNSKDTFILAMPSTYAEDVKAIEASTGVISREGGYASHAPVVARSLGKVAMVNPDIEFKDNNTMLIGKKVVKEGDYISMDVPPHSEPIMYFDKIDLIEPNIDKSGLLEFLEVVQGQIDDFDVYVNADQPKDAKLAMKFLASGIGLCRTEHMFFHEKRIPIFRSLVIAKEQSERTKILAKIKKMQVSDFYAMFEILGEKPVTIRLLDAPLHEFLPHNRKAMIEFIDYYRKIYPDVSADEVRLRCEMTNEVNPMLGHRGVRMSITYPEIYRMQVEAIFEAAYKIRKEKGILCKPEIMIPIVMNPSEIKASRFGKQIEGHEIVGIKTIEERLREKLGVEPIPYEVGTMIELPAAALMADDIAAYADFFSFGTNDLTQTCLGLSRDDFNSFFTDYNEFDLLGKNPFQYLQKPVKELISTAINRGRISRPDLVCGLCGEHGAEPSNIEFCMSTGLNYVSCSPYGIPIAKLTIAQRNISKKNL